MRKKLVDKISDSWEIPREVLSNVQKIVITGNGMVHIEGFIGIAELNDERIVVKVKNGSVVIFGSELCVGEITEEYIDLKGVVKSVEIMWKIPKK